MRHKEWKMETMVERIQPVGPSNILTTWLRYSRTRATLCRQATSEHPSMRDMKAPLSAGGVCFIQKKNRNNESRSRSVDCESLTPIQGARQQSVDCESLTPTQGATEQSVDCESLTPTQGAMQQSVDCESLTPTQGATQQSVDCGSLTPTRGATQQSVDSEIVPVSSIAPEGWGPKEGGNARSPLHSQGSPNKRGQNQKSKPPLGVTMMLLVSQSMGLEYS